MQIISSFFDEIVPQVLFSLLNSCLFGLIFDLITHILFLFLVEQGWYHTDSQQVIDQL